MGEGRRFVCEEVALGTKSDRSAGCSVSNGGWNFKGGSQDVRVRGGGVGVSIVEQFLASHEGIEHDLFPRVLFVVEELSGVDSCITPPVHFVTRMPRRVAANGLSHLLSA